jgi:hypothetical protein
MILLVIVLVGLAVVDIIEFALGWPWAWVLVPNAIVAFVSGVAIGYWSAGSE